MKWRAWLGLILGWSIEAVADPASVPDLKPNPALTPKQVIEFQLQVLQHNDELAENRGIERAFRFASPNNRTITGPLQHFIQIINQPDYSALLNSASYLIGQVEIENDQARSIVTITTTADERMRYVFILSRQSGGEYKDCWMTDAVLPVQEDEDDLIHT
jgi:Domain of unknown function (DUF4864)